MNNLKTLVASFIISVSAIAQPTLTDANFSTVNENYVFSTLVDLTVDYNSTGANYNWDFSTLSTTDQRWLINKPVNQAGQLANLFFGSFAPAAYKATYFALATDLPIDEWTTSFPVTFDEISQFTKNTSTSINSIGFEFVISGQGVAAKSDTIEHRYELPLEYGDSYSSRGYTDLDMNPIYDAEWRQHRGRVSNVDGWGTVATPWGTFTALRIHHRIEEIDSFYVTVNGNGTWIPIPVPDAHIYEWRSLDDKEPVMTIKTSEIAGNEVVTAVEYRDEYNGLGVENPNINLSVYPNPTTEIISYELSSKPSNVSFIDMKGKVILTQAIDKLQGSIDIANFAPGSYHMVINTEQGVISSLIVKK
jgi:hypothetical protein